MSPAFTAMLCGAGGTSLGFAAIRVAAALAGAAA
jgi:hypothetical protein